MVVEPPKPIKGGLSKGEQEKLSGIKPLILEETKGGKNQQSIVILIVDISSKGWKRRTWRGCCNII
jgi:hypothetical protein